MKFLWTFYSSLMPASVVCRLGASENQSPAVLEEDESDRTFGKLL